MSVLEIIGGVLLLISCVILIGLVMMQEAKQGGLGSSFGDTSADSYYGKNSGRTLEAMMGRFTKYFGIAFFVLVVLVSIFTVYVG